MPKYRSNLPLTSSKLFLTDGGIETTLVFNEAFDLPHFAAFDLLKSFKGVQALRAYYTRHASIARANGVGFVLESPTWRASADWGRKLGYTDAQLADVNRKAIQLMTIVRDELETDTSPMVISGCVGPRGDGYVPGRTMSAPEAEAYHATQIGVFERSEADMVCAITMNYAEEAIGIARAAASAKMPVAISFTVETDGRLPTGQSLGDAIAAVDEATGAAPLYYMINCAHPTHFAHVLASGETWVGRLRGIRANASKRSHAELDAAQDLDAGDPVELGRSYAGLRRRLPQLNVLGGCCGTDHRHIEQICVACLPPTPQERRLGPWAA
jgi:S-methylmethionine-dependent homocysteine/selenocysteine methylase